MDGTSSWRRLFEGRCHEVAPLSESVWSRAWRDTTCLLSTWWFGLAYLVGAVFLYICTFPILSSSAASAKAKLVTGASALVGGFLLGGILLYGFVAARTPCRQRNEARAEVKGLRRPERPLAILVQPWKSRESSGRFPEPWVFEINQVDDGIMFSWRKWFRESVPRSALCSVQDPFGNHHPARVTWTPSLAYCVYPQDFEMEAMNGSHWVYWFARSDELPISNTNDRPPDDWHPWIDPHQFTVRLEGESLSRRSVPPSAWAEAERRG